MFLFASIGTPKLSVRKFDDLISCAKALHDLGPQYVLLKGDQLPLNGDYEVPVLNNDKQVVVDVLYDGTEVSLIKTAYVVAAPKEAKYALACMLSTSETMISTNNNHHQPQSLRILPLGTLCHQPFRRPTATSKLVSVREMALSTTFTLHILFHSPRTLCPLSLLEPLAH